jgi:hypothetical protein
MSQFLPNLASVLVVLYPWGTVLSSYTASLQQHCGSTEPQRENIMCCNFHDCSVLGVSRSRSYCSVGIISDLRLLDAERDGMMLSVTAGIEVP